MTDTSTRTTTTTTTREDSKETKSSEEDDGDTTTTNITSTSWFRDHAKEWLDQWTRGGLANYVSLPMICVLGDTSSGKSSVLSSLIGLELPSASTLTTKCPVLIQLQQGSTHKATIDIQWHTHNSNKKQQDLPDSPRHRKRTIERKVEERLQPQPMVEPSLKDAAVPPPLPPPPPPPKWKVRTLTSHLETKVPEIIQEAQQAILDFRETLVAPDVIFITLWSPSCVEELTLVDLPGLVQFQHEHDVSLLSQVEQVVLEYVHNPRSILLPVLPAPTNLHNSKVLQWTKQVDPHTVRTIPVLTKPDLMDPGSEIDVVELLQSSSSQFQHGFYLVKNRGQASLDAGATLDHGLQEEQDYFASTLPWNAIPQQPSPLGIPALRTKLAQVLWQVLQDTLPDILQDLQEHYQHVHDSLEAMGTIYHTRSDQRKFYHSLTQELVTQVSSSLSGKGPRKSSSSSSRNRNSSRTTQVAGASQLHAACHVFLRDIQGGSLATINKLVEGATILVSSTGTADDIRGELVHIDLTHKFACVDFCDRKDHSTDVLFDGIGYSVTQPDFEEDEVWSDGSRVFMGRAGSTFDSLRKIPLNRIRTDPSWLEDKMAQFRTDDLACFVNVDMFQHVVAEFVQDDWAPPCHKLVGTLERILTDTLDGALKDHLETTRYPLLRTMMESTCHRVANRLLETARTQVKEHLDLEEQHPYTQDEVMLQAMNQSRFQSLRNDLDLQLRLEQEGVEGVVYDTQAIQTILDRVFAKHQRNHWMAEQMELVLSCYGKVATQRVLDRTPQICWQTTRSLAKALLEELGCVTDDVLETCLWESPESRQRFQELTNKLHDLQKAMDVVKSIR
jgi:hypothetical protein